ncbi:hypothetical protein [Streptomyces sp. NPDC014733]|uniref:hypothetical protein n=1 Tax=Streptomyces sp. NPDC014733 TaxID=3364885 RepID=UPI0036FC8268
MRGGPMQRPGHRGTPHGHDRAPHRHGGELTAHLAACLRHAPVAPSACSGAIYDITLGRRGAVTHLREAWHF